MKKLLFTIPGHEVLSRQLLTHDGWTAGQAIFRHFPDGESYVHLL